MKTYLLKINRRRRDAIGSFQWAHYVVDAKDMDDAIRFAQRLAWESNYETAGVCVYNPDH